MDRPEADKLQVEDLTKMRELQFTGAPIARLREGMRQAPATNQNGTLRNANQPNIIEQPRRSDNANVINKPATQENNRRVNETPGTTPNVPRQSTINTISSPLNNQAPQTERRSGLNTGASNQPASTVNPAPNIKQDNQNGRHDNLTEKKEQSSEIRNEQPKRPEQQRSNVQPLKKENKPTARKEAPKAEDKKKDDDKRR